MRGSDFLTLKMIILNFQLRFSVEDLYSREKEENKTTKDLEFNEQGRINNLNRKIRGEIKIRKQ